MGSVMLKFCELVILFFVSGIFFNVFLKMQKKKFREAGAPRMDRPALRISPRTYTHILISKKEFPGFLHNF